VIVLLDPILASAQGPKWDRVYIDTLPFGSGYFFDEQSGLVGSGVRLSNYHSWPTPGRPIAILKTTDGGKTWKKAKVPFGYKGAVTDIFMRDRSFGYASIFTDKTFPNRTTPASPCLWYTTDGGDNWQVLGTLQGEASSVYETKKGLIYTTWDNQNYGYPQPRYEWGGISTDGGTSWKHFLGPQGNGIDFVDDTTGVVTQLSSSNEGFWRTTDGGLSWIDVPYQDEAWSVYGIKGTQTFLTANEGGFGSTIRYSDDGGRSWFMRYQFPQRTYFTGHIEGVGGRIYIQTDTSEHTPPTYRGMYRSDDTGKSWKKVYGPDNSRDSRFVVTGCSGEVVYAFDAYGGIWKTTSGGDGSASADPQLAEITTLQNSIHVAPQSCSDSTNFTIYVSGCSPVWIDSVSLKDVLIARSVKIGKRLFMNDTLPVKVTLNAQDSILQDSITVFAHAETRHFTYALPIIIDPLPKEHLIFNADTLICSVTNCGRTVDTLKVNFKGCGTYSIDSLSFEDGFTVNGIPDPTTQLNSTVKLPFQYTGPFTNDFTTTLKLFVQSNGERLDTTVTIRVLSRIAEPRLLGSFDTLFFETRYCVPVIHSLKLINPDCDTLVIDSVRILDNDFTVKTTLTSVAYNQQDSLQLTFTPSSIDTIHGALQLFGHNSAFPYTHQIPLLGTNFAKIDAHTLSDTLIEFTSTTCESITKPFWIQSDCCDSLFIDSIGSEHPSIAVSGFTPSVLYHGTRIEPRITYTPAVKEDTSTILHIYGRLGNKELDTLVHLKVKNSLPKELLTTSVDTLYLQTSRCEPATDSFWIKNNGCDAITLNELAVRNDTLGEFHVASVTTASSEDSTKCILSFIPNSGGKIEKRLVIKGTSGNHSFERSLIIKAVNKVAPELYFDLSAVSSSAGSTIQLPVYLRKTNEAFRIDSFRFSFELATDLLSPISAETLNTLSQGSTVQISQVSLNGFSVSGTLNTPVTEQTDLDKPLFIIPLKVYLTQTPITDILLKNAVINDTALTGQCDKPIQRFTLSYECADSSIVTFMQGGQDPLSIVSVFPNPTDKGAQVTINYSVRSKLPNTLILELIDAQGRTHYSSSFEARVGDHSVSLPAHQPSGEYFLVLRSGNVGDIRKIILR